MARVASRLRAGSVPFWKSCILTAYTTNLQTNSAGSMSPAAHLNENQIFLVASVWSSLCWKFFRLCLFRSEVIKKRFSRSVSGLPETWKFNMVRSSWKWCQSFTFGLCYHFFRLDYSLSQTRGQNHSIWGENLKWTDWGKNGVNRLRFVCAGGQWYFFRLCSIRRKDKEEIRNFKVLYGIVVGCWRHENSKMLGLSQKWCQSFAFRLRWFELPFFSFVLLPFPTQGEKIKTTRILYI